MFPISSTDLGLEDVVTVLEYVVGSRHVFTHQTAAEGKFPVCENAVATLLCGLDPHIIGSFRPWSLRKFFFFFFFKFNVYMQPFGL